MDNTICPNPCVLGNTEEGTKVYNMPLVKFCCQRNDTLPVNIYCHCRFRKYRTSEIDL